MSRRRHFTVVLSSASRAHRRIVKPSPTEADFYQPPALDSSLAALRDPASSPLEYAKALSVYIDRLAPEKRQETDLGQPSNLNAGTQGTTPPPTPR